MKDKFIELSDSDGVKVTVLLSNIAWFKGEESGTMIAFNFVGQNNSPFVLRVKEDYAKIKKLLS